MRNEITDLEIDDITVFNVSSKEKVINIKWSANIGWGECDLVYDDGKLYANTECMCSKEDKTFLRMLMNKLVEDCVVNS